MKIRNLCLSLDEIAILLNDQQKRIEKLEAEQANTPNLIKQEVRKQVPQIHGPAQ